MKKSSIERLTKILAIIGTSISTFASKAAHSVTGSVTKLQARTAVSSLLVLIAAAKSSQALGMDNRSGVGCGSSSPPSSSRSMRSSGAVSLWSKLVSNSVLEVCGRKKTQKSKSGACREWAGGRKCGESKAKTRTKTWAEKKRKGERKRKDRNSMADMSQEKKKLKI